MNKRTSILGLGVLAILVIGTFSFSAFAQDSELSIIGSKGNSHSAKFVPGQLIVGLEKPDPNFNAKASLHGGQVINSIDQINAIVVKVPLNTEEKFISAISKNPNVVYVERDAIMTATGDQYLEIQWGLQHIGMDSVWADPAIDPSLGTGIIVAVVDTGIYDNHPDFAGTTIRTDIDYDFIDDDDDTRPTTTCGNSAEYHGTFVAGIIAATKDNTIGVSGIGPFEILPVRVLNNCGSGSSSAVSNGITWAVDHGAKVINLSLGSSVPSNTIENAINYAHGEGGDAVIVAASGNDGTSQTHYPSGFTNAISVGATTNTYEKASYSQYGSTLELAAPGGSSGACSSSGTPYIVSTGVGVSGGSTYFSYQCGTGTSFAAPHASGVAALLRAANPDACNEEIRLHLQQTAEDLTDDGEDWDEYFGYGLVRADDALSTPITPLAICAPTTTDTTPPEITLVGADPQLIEVGDPYVELGATAIDNYDGDISGSIVIDASAVNTSVLGDYPVTYDVDDSSGNSATTVTRTVTIQDTTPPVITLVDADPQLIEVGDPYVELGATAIDNYDGDISDSIVIDASAVNTAVLGDYPVTYDVDDSSGNSATTVTRTVRVQNTALADPTVYVASLEGSVSGKKNLNYQVTITLGGDSASGVMIYGMWSNNPLTTVSCQADVPGQCTVKQTTKDVPPLTFSIMDLGTNVYYDESSSVTLIVVDRDDEGGSGGGNEGSWDCTTKPHPKKCP